MDSESVQKVVEELFAFSILIADTEEWDFISARLATIIHLLTASTHNIDAYTLSDTLENLIEYANVLRSCNEKKKQSEDMMTIDVSRSLFTQQQIRSTLLSMVSRLSMIEFILTNDHNRKNRALIATFHELQILRQMMHQREKSLRTHIVDHGATTNSSMDVTSLHKKHFNVIMPYLKQCSSFYGTISITALEADIVVETARNFYKASATDLNKLKANWRSFDIPLSECFIDLQTEKTTSFERNAARQLLTGNRFAAFFSSVTEHKQKKIWMNRLLDTPYMLSIVNSDRYAIKDEYHSSDIIQVLRENRWVVALGHPGSGKSTLSQWVALQSAQGIMNKKETTDFGPARIPILIRIAEFAEALRENDTLSLFDHIGHHTWFGKYFRSEESTSTSALSQLAAALQDYVRQGQAVVIIDGLDEISVSDQRAKILHCLETFIHTHIRAPSLRSVMDDPNFVRHIDKPAETGGNQILITSRIVGYHAAPLTGQFSHYIIQPLSSKLMQAFVDYWFYHIHANIRSILVSSNAEILLDDSVWQDHAEPLKTQLEDRNSELRELASNPFLMSLICHIAFESNDAALPTKRVQLYERAINSILSTWNGHGLNINESKLLWILGDVAEDIHKNSPSGLISEEILLRRCASSIQSYENIKRPTDDDSERFKNEAMRFVEIVRNDVGILVCRSQSMYGFLHRTLQEYFAGLNFVDKRKLKKENQSMAFSATQAIARSLCEHISDIRFRVPLILAFSMLSERDDFEAYCEAFFAEAARELDSFLPLGTLFFVLCDRDFVNYPSNGIMFKALDKILVAAGRDNWYSTSEALFSTFQDSIQTLPKSCMSEWVHHVLLSESRQSFVSTTALCNLISDQLYSDKIYKHDNVPGVECDNDDDEKEDENDDDNDFSSSEAYDDDLIDTHKYEWLDKTVCDNLYLKLDFHQAQNDFSLDRLFVHMSFINRQLLPTPHNSLKTFFTTGSCTQSDIHPTVLALIIALYGGLAKSRNVILFEAECIYQDCKALTPLLIEYLTDINSEQLVRLKRLQNQCQKLLSTILPDDGSVNAVNVIIAVLCLSGIEHFLIHPNLVKIKAFSMALSKLKYILSTLQDFYSNTSFEFDAERIISDTLKLTDPNVSNRDKRMSPEDFLLLTNAVMKATARLSTNGISSSVEDNPYDNTQEGEHAFVFTLPNELRSKEVVENLLSYDTTLSSGRKACSVLPYFVSLFWTLNNEDVPLSNRTESVRRHELTFLHDRFGKDFMYALTFVPKHIRSLFVYLLQRHEIVIQDREVSSTNLPFQYVLIECLMKLVNDTDDTLLKQLCTLLPLLRVYKLDNFGFSIIKAYCSSHRVQHFEYIRQRPLDENTYRYKDGLSLVPEVPKDYPEVDGDEVFIKNLQNERARLQSALQKLRRSSQDTQASIHLYSACVSLAYMSSCSQLIEPTILLTEAINAANSIELPLLKLDALSVIFMNLHVQVDSNLMASHRSLIHQQAKLLNEITSKLSIPVHTAILLRCHTVFIQASEFELSVRDLLNKITATTNGKVYSSQEAVYEALLKISYSNELIHSYLADLYSKNENVLKHEPQTLFHTRSSILFRYFTRSSIYSKTPTVNTLLSAMFLTELVSDCHRLFAWHNLIFDANYYNLPRPNRPNKPNFENNGTLMHFQALAIDQYLSDCIKKKSISMEMIQNLDRFLHSVSTVESTAWEIVNHWLIFENHQQLNVIAVHAALLSLEAYLWNEKATVIACNQLCSRQDRFRQRAEVLFRRDSASNTSDLGLNSLLALLDRYIWCCHNSTYAESTIFTMLYHTSINREHHLHIVLLLEQYRIIRMNSNDINIDDQDLYGAVKIATANNYFNVSFCLALYQLSSSLHSHMSDIIRSKFSIVTNHSSLKKYISKTDYELFVVNVLISIGICLYHNRNYAATVTEAIIEMMGKTTSSRIQRAAIYAIGSTKDGTEFLWGILQSFADSSNKNTKMYSEDVICTLIQTCCYRLSRDNSFEDEENIKVFLQLLKHQSPNIAKATREGMGRAINSSERLLELFQYDKLQCYEALIASTAHMYFGQKSTDVRATADLILKHPDLLSIFIAELYESIRYLLKEGSRHSFPKYTYEYEHPHYLSVSSVLIDKMPSAFCSFIGECGYGEELKRAIYCASKVRRNARRITYLVLLSIFGEFTSELCEMAVEVLIDDPYKSNKCYECLWRIHRIKDEKAIDKLFKYFKSPSMNVRYAALKVLLHLTSLGLIHIAETQDILVKTMNDPESNENLWLAENNQYSKYVRSYENVGKLKQVVYNSLAMHLLDLRRGGVAFDFNNNLTDEERAFQASELNASLTIGLFKKNGYWDYD
ncbi:unnamed protein product [Adineta ricciae]|uniref:NACHT domain-containing protein n=3 Tax=Adineta ricciae TaxID=249248 RepID=A0A814X428_ADIRI|nr:unnamed protein product [Adineta ricciae]